MAKSRKSVCDDTAATCVDFMGASTVRWKATAWESLVPIEGAGSMGRVKEMDDKAENRLNEGNGNNVS